MTRKQKEDKGVYIVMRRCWTQDGEMLEPGEKVELADSKTVRIWLNRGVLKHYIPEEDGEAA